MSLPCSKSFNGSLLCHESKHIYNGLCMPGTAVRTVDALSPILISICVTEEGIGHREVKWLAQGHAAGSVQSWGWTRGLALGYVLTAAILVSQGWRPDPLHRDLGPGYLQPLRVLPCSAIAHCLQFLKRASFLWALWQCLPSNWALETLIFQASSQPSVLL